MSERGISSAVIRRLPRYYRHLGELLENNVVRISSKEFQYPNESDGFTDPPGS